jgi:hypothetical protein
MQARLNQIYRSWRLVAAVAALGASFACAMQTRAPCRPARQSSDKFLFDKAMKLNAKR